MEEPHFFNARDGLKVTQNRLPHWQQTGGIYFVTFRLADSLPAEVLRSWNIDQKTWLRRNPPPHTTEQEEEYHRLFSLTMERALDTGHGSCVLRAPAVAEIVAEALHFYEGKRSELFSFTVMPNHVHAVFGLRGGAVIDALIKDWKSYTSHALAKLPGRTWAGWQKDYFDRLVRDGRHFERCVRYIRRNPEKAGLRAGEFILWESERAKAVM